MKKITAIKDIEKILISAIGINYRMKNLVAIGMHLHEIDEKVLKLFQHDRDNNLLGEVKLMLSTTKELYLDAAGLVTGGGYNPWAADEDWDDNNDSEADEGDEEELLAEIKSNLEKCLIYAKALAIAYEKLPGNEKS